MKTLIVVVLMVTGIRAFAQPAKLPVHYGIKAGVNFSKYHFSSSTAGFHETHSNIRNFYLAGYRDLSLSSRISVQSGLSIQGKGSSMFIPDHIELGDIMVSARHLRQTTVWLEVPINFVLSLPSRRIDYFVGAGPYAAAALAGRNEYTSSKGEITRKKLDFFPFFQGDLESFDFGANFIGGLQLKQGYAVSAGYGLGLVNVSGIRMKRYNSRVLSFAVGYSFKLHRDE
jgi:hypothetical protein